MAILLSMELLWMLRYVFSFDTPVLVIKLLTQNLPSIFLPPCVQAALDHLSQRTDIDTSRIVVFGRSLGGAVGSVLTKNNPDKVPPDTLQSIYFEIDAIPGKSC